jgi:Na+-transporting methylmalonyl-CoA/oxaloacetate decarboxylase gamma subunit
MVSILLAFLTILIGSLISRMAEKKRNQPQEMRKAA